MLLLTEKYYKRNEQGRFNEKEKKTMRKPTHYIITPWPMSVHIWAKNKKTALSRYLALKPYFIEFKLKQYSYIIKEKKGVTKRKRLRL